MTSGSAYQMQRSDDVGTIEVGKEADIIVLSRNLLTCKDNEIMDTVVLSTMSDGEFTYAELTEDAYEEGTYLDFFGLGKYDDNCNIVIDFSDNTYLDLKKNDDRTYTATINSTDDSGKAIEWTMTCTYDKELDSLCYQDCKKTVDGDVQYSEGKGLIRNQGGYLHWLDYTERAGSAMYFNRIAS